MKVYCEHSITATCFGHEFLKLNILHDIWLSVHHSITFLLLPT